MSVRGEAVVANLLDAGDDEMSHEAAEYIGHLQGLLKEVREVCFFEDDNGVIGVSSEVVIPSDLFDRINEEVT